MAPRRSWWTVGEIKALLEIIQQMKLVELLDGKRQRNKIVFENLALEMASAGYNKTGEQIKTKWKSLKKDYHQRKRALRIGAECNPPPPYFDMLEEILSYKQSNQSDDIGFESGFVVEDNANTEVISGMLADNGPQINLVKAGTNDKNETESDLSVTDSTTHEGTTSDNEARNTRQTLLRKRVRNEKKRDKYVELLERQIQLMEKDREDRLREIQESREWEEKFAAAQMSSFQTMFMTMTQMIPNFHPKSNIMPKGPSLDSQTSESKPSQHPQES